MSPRSQYLLFSAMSFAGAGLLAWAGFVQNAFVGKPAEARIFTALLFLGVGGGFYFFVHAFFEPADPRGPTLRYLPSPEVAFEYSAGEGARTSGATTEALRAAL